MAAKAGGLLESRWMLHESSKFPLPTNSEVRMEVATVT
jgi:hypothetical protein